MIKEQKYFYDKIEIKFVKLKSECQQKHILSLIHFGQVLNEPDKHLCAF